MTTNQLMLLLDVSRGLRAEIHPGTFPDDLLKLKAMGLVKADDTIFKYTLTTLGHLMVGKVIGQTTRWTDEQRKKWYDDQIARCKAEHEKRICELQRERDA